jgi:hypothetical protein
LRASAVVVAVGLLVGPAAGGRTEEASPLMVCGQNLGGGDAAPIVTDVSSSAVSRVDGGRSGADIFVQLTDSCAVGAG